LLINIQVALSSASCFPPLPLPPCPGPIPSVSLALFNCQCSFLIDFIRRARRSRRGAAAGCSIHAQTHTCRPSHSIASGHLSTLRCLPLPRPRPLPGPTTVMICLPCTLLSNVKNTNKPAKSKQISVADKVLKGKHRFKSENKLTKSNKSSKSEIDLVHLFLKEGCAEIVSVLQVITRVINLLHSMYIE